MHFNTSKVINGKSKVIATKVQTTNAMNGRNREGVLNFSEAKANKNASVAIKGQRNAAPIISEWYIANWQATD